MKYYSDFEELKIYRNPTMLVTESNVMDKTNSMIILPTFSFEETSNILGDIYSNKYFRNSKYFYKSYYIDRIYNYSVVNKRVKNRLDRDLLYKEVRSNNKPIRKTYKNIELNPTDSHILYDMYKHNSLFMEATEGRTSQVKIQAYFDFLGGKLKELESIAKDKILLVKITEDNLGDIDRVMNPDSILGFITALSLRPLKSDVGEEFNIKVIFYSGRAKFTMNLKQYMENSKEMYNKLKLCLNRLKSNIDIDEIDETILDSEVENVIQNKVAKPHFTLTGEELPHDNSETEEKLKEIVKDKVSHRVSNDGTISEEDIEKTLDSDEVKLELVQSSNRANVLGTTPRDRELREKALKLELEGKTLEDIMKKSEKGSIQKINFKINSVNDNMKSSSITRFNKTYNEEYKDADIIGMMDSLSDKEVPMYIREINKVDSSDAFNKKETWTVKFEDAKRVRHTLKFDVPVMVDDKFFYLGGNKKNMLNQLVLKPVVKTAPDTVQVCTNYNKIFLTRYGMKMTPKTEKFVKTLFSKESWKGVSITKGNSKSINGEYKTSLEYDIVSEGIMTISIPKRRLNINFIISENEGNDKEYSDTSKYIPIGTLEGKSIYLDLNTDNVVGKNIGSEIHFIDFIIDNISRDNPTFKDEYFKASGGTKFVYTRATIMAKKIPLIYLLAYCEGLTSVLNKSGMNYYFSDKRVQFKEYEKDTKGIVKFEDGYLIYDKYPMENSLLMNGLSAIDTSKYKVEDLNKRLTYVDIFTDLVDSPNIINAFSTFYNVFIDKPITHGVLQDMSLPTDFVGLLLYANGLLGDNSYVTENDLNNYRLRNAEIVTALVYKQVSKAYGTYLNTHTNNNPMKMSVPQNAVINELNSSNIVEDYSTLSPTLELERLRAVTFKGPNGLNLEQAYTLDKRSFHKSMLGIVAMSSPPTGAVGLTRYLSVNPKVSNVRGYLDVIQSDDDIKDLSQSNVLMTSEMITPTVGMRDDAPRLAMNTAQTKHIVPVTKGSPVLMGNGVERSMPYLTGDDFAFKAKKSGKVTKIEEDLVFLQYDDGTKDFIDLKLAVEKNGGSGYYISNKLKLDEKIKVGSKFDELDILAYNDKFYSSRDIKGDRGFKMGALKKIAIMNDQETFEDSTSLSKETAEDLGTEVVMKKQVILDKNANIDLKSMVKVGDDVVSGDNLLIYEEGFDQDLSRVLGSIRADLEDEINEFGKKPVKTKYSGEIVDIKIYYNCEEEEMSDSLKKLIKEYRASVEKRNKIIRQASPDIVDPIRIESVQKYESYDSKIKGVTVEDGVMIEFYVRYLDIMSVGDKLTNFCALKSIVCKVYEEPKFTEFRPEEALGAELGTRSYMARMTGSIVVNMFTNKVLIELARASKSILEEDVKFYDRVDGKYLEKETKK